MDDYSRLNGTVPVSPTSSGVWKIQKKRRTDDRQRQTGKKNRKPKKEKEMDEILSGHEFESEGEQRIDDDTEEEAVYGSNKPKKRASRKLDVTI